jgi:Domain of unknown function (DUF4288)
MKWYLAKLVYRIICGDGNHTSQFDEQLRLIYAEDDFHAFTKARLIGEKEEDHFQSFYKKPVKWKFIDVSEMHLLDNLIDGAELYSRINEQDDAETYIRSTQTRAKDLFEKSIHPLLLN